LSPNPAKARLRRPFLMSFEIRLLAGFEVRLHGQAVTHWQRAAAKRLLKLLAIAPQHSVSVNQLVMAFWPQDLGERVRQRLHHLVYLLNEALTSPGTTQRWVEVRDGLVRLASGPGLWIDIDQFEQQLAQAMAAPPPGGPSPSAASASSASSAVVDLQAALALYVGSLLPGDTNDSALGPRREQLAQRAWAGWHALADAQQHAGLHVAAQVALQQAVALAPADESAHCKLMQLHASLGQRDAVERQYQACKAALALGLGVQPSAQTHQAYRDAMLEGIRGSKGVGGSAAAALDTAPQAPQRWVPPIPLVTLIDREPLLHDIKLALANDSQRLVTLLGAGGMGKTQLALRVAHELAPSWRHGACFVALAEVGPEGVLECIRHALQCADPASRDVAALITEHLRDKQLLLVADNCEHVVQSLGVLAQVLSQAPGVKVLATSRRPLNLQGENMLPVPPLKPTPGSAMKLFVERARAVAPGFKLDAQTRADVLAITQRLDGVPLSIELVAARAHAYSPSALNSALQAGFAATVAGGGADRPERHQSLQQSLAWSYSLLHATDQAVLHQAALFRAPFELAALHSLCQADGTHFPQTAQALHELGFLATAVVGAPPASIAAAPRARPAASPALPTRLRVPAGALEFLRSLGPHRGPLAPSAVGSSHAMFVQWFVDRINSLDTSLQGPDAAQARRLLDADHDNHFAALEFASALGDPALAARGVARLVLGLSRYWRLSGAWSRADDWVAKSCSLGRLLAPAMHMDLLLVAASHWFESQRFELAREHAKQAMAAARPRQEITQQSRATLLFAAATYHLGQPQAAVKPLLKISALARAAGREDIDTVAQNNLGSSYLSTGQLALAESTFAACDAKQRGPSSQGRTAGLLNRALVAHYQGRRAEALDLSTSALAMEHSGLPRPARLAMVWARTSWMWCCHAEVAQAEQALQQAQAVADQAQLLVWQRLCAALHGKILLLKGQAQYAQTVLSRSVRECHNLADPWDVLDTSLWLLWAQLQTPAGLPAARATLGRVVSTYGLSWQHEHPRILEAAAACLVAGQDFKGAARAWHQAQWLRQTQGSKRFVAEQAHARKTQTALRAALGRDWRNTTQTSTPTRSVNQSPNPSASQRASQRASKAEAAMAWLRDRLL
jgi:DNA-binding SARP family transcriptional activator/tetratricopeptide (TPR) repeat protein